MRKIAVLLALLMLTLPFSASASWDITGTDGRSYNLDELGKGITLAHTLNINPDAAEIPGVQYHSIAHALTYIAAQTPVPSATNRWGLLVSGTLSENIDLGNMAYIHIVGTKNAVLTGTIDNSVESLTSLEDAFAKILIYPWAISGVTINNLSNTHLTEIILEDCVVTGGTTTNGFLVAFNTKITGGTFNMINIILNSEITGGTYEKTYLFDCEVFGGTFNSQGNLAVDTLFFGFYNTLEISGGEFTRCILWGGEDPLSFPDGAKYSLTDCAGMSDFNMSEATGVTLSLNNMHYRNISVGNNTLKTSGCFGGDVELSSGSTWENNGVNIVGARGSFTKLQVPVLTTAPVNAIAAAATLTASDVPANADTVTIDTVTYTFVSTTPDSEGEVLIGATAADTLTNLRTAINLESNPGGYYCASAHPTVSAASTAGALVATAKTRGYSGNYIAVSETSANLDWGSGVTTLSGGVDGTVGAAGQTFIDSSYLYYSTADNTVSGANWRRVSLGSAY